MSDKLSPAVEASTIVQVVLRTEANEEEQRRRISRIKRAIRRETGRRIQNLAVELQGDALLLRGRCASFHCKQVAQQAAMSFLSGNSLVNQIEVDTLPR
jgi:hypothetical protein